ncbi:hypothetical protein CW663_04270 [Macrococcoides caseolyticum]|uniref:DUF4004 family protein n=1 Tax=Macrococcoides caseolyticum TaxID=69966 RepID=UPI000C32FBB3|nr:DUF4004 family protein [Macrococcus caseolyticus]PKE16593.1 hypothetical protein CW718_08960 [Macrococcus caseolyticus]PKE68057.1 hypothetical protein CW663_04270 [Macrococcus caseolyticus]
MFAEPYWKIAESIFNKRNNVSHNEVKDVNYYFVRAMGVFILVCAKEIVKISDNAKIIYELDDTKIQLAIQQKLKRGSHDDKESKY